MELSTILMIIAVIVVVIIIIVFYFFDQGSGDPHMLIFQGKTIATSKSNIANTSDGQNLIYYGYDSVYEYNTTTKTSKKISTIVPKSLAYDENLLILDNDGTIHQYNEDGTTETYATGATNLYDTVGGLYIEIGGIKGYSTNSTRANGNYGLIQYTIK